MSASAFLSGASRGSTVGREGQGRNLEKLHRSTRHMAADKTSVAQPNWPPAPRTIRADDGLRSKEFPSLFIFFTTGDVRGGREGNEGEQSLNTEPNTASVHEVLAVIVLGRWSQAQVRTSYHAVARKKAHKDEQKANRNCLEHWSGAGGAAVHVVWGGGITVESTANGVKGCQIV